MTHRSMGIRPSNNQGPLFAAEADTEMGIESGDGPEEGADDAESDEDEESIIGVDEVSPPPVRVATSPTAPTAEERENHNATHLPYRSWCSTCVAGKGRRPALPEARGWKVRQADSWSRLQEFWTEARGRQVNSNFNA